ncbi:hypothetical protein HMPREF9946_01716 [Acetobacteraceae bacterium AT-5844]|nr:hypothetical protein HMPREF9946_01716 [Acetobacteraceae bacterium AT-5844]
MVWIQGATQILCIDGEIQLSGTSSEARLQGLYTALLGRNADDAGLVYWISQITSGLSLEEVAQQFTLSKEFYEVTAEMTIGEIVTHLYYNGLGRAPDEEGKQYFLSRLVGGAGIGAVAAGIIASEEYSLHFQSRHPAGMTITDSAASIIIDGYQALLGRYPDAYEVSFWKKDMLNTSMNPTGIFKQIISSPEFSIGLGTLNNANFIESLYKTVLGRLPDESGLRWWSAELDNGSLSRADMAWLFISSSEYQGRKSVNQVEI